MKKSFFLLSLFLSCTDSTDKYYDVQESNSRILIAFAVKDAECGSKHNLKSIVPGNARKTDINLCVNSILIKSCIDWNVTDPTPLQCQTINYKLD
jgi:hypothetical protein